MSPYLKWFLGHTAMCMANLAAIEICDSVAVTVISGYAAIFSGYAAQLNIIRWATAKKIS